jgi:hypothetical protein
MTKHQMPLLGDALALAGWTAFMRAAQTLKANGSFSGLADLAPYAEINEFLAADLHARQARKSDHLHTVNGGSS